MKQMKYKYLLPLLAAPALAGLMFVAGCDEDDEVGAARTGTGTSAGTGTATDDTDTATPAAGTESGTGMTGAGTAGTGAAGTGGAAGMEVSDTVIEQLSQKLETAQETAEAYKDQIEENVDIEGWGTGAPASEMLGNLNEKLDAVQAAVRERDWATTATNMTEIVRMPMPRDLKQQVQGIVDQMKTLNVPALSGLSGMMGGDIGGGAMPAMPGSGSGATGGGAGGMTPPSTRPSGGGQ